MMMMMMINVNPLAVAYRQNLTASPNISEPLLAGSDFFSKSATRKTERLALTYPIMHLEAGGGAVT